MADDEELVKRALEDAEQYGRLVEKHWRTLVGLAFQKLGNLVDAEDVAQRGLVQAYRSLKDLREQGRFLPWVARIVSRLAGEEIGRRTRNASVSLHEEAAVNVSSPSAATTLDTEMNEKLNEAMGELPENYRVTLILRYQENLSGAEIAQLLGEPSGTIRSRITRGLRLLHERLGATLT